jgi:hypothetical protein
VVDGLDAVAGLLRTLADQNLGACDRTEVR